MCIKAKKSYFKFTEAAFLIRYDYKHNPKLFFESYTYYIDLLLDMYKDKVLTFEKYDKAFNIVCKLWNKVNKRIYN